MVGVCRKLYWADFTTIKKWIFIVEIQCFVYTEEVSKNCFIFCENVLTEFNRKHFDKCGFELDNQRVLKTGKIWLSNGEKRKKTQRLRCLDIIKVNSGVLGLRISETQYCAFILKFCHLLKEKCGFLSFISHLKKIKTNYKPPSSVSLIKILFKKQMWW